MWAAFRFPAPLRSWALFDTRPYISFSPFLDCPHFLLYYSIIPAVMTQSYWASFRPVVSFFPSGLAWPLVLLLMAPMSLSSFSWASLAHLLSLGSLIPFTNSALPWGFTNLGFPGPTTSFSFLGFMGLPLTPYFLCLHYFWTCSGSFSLFYIIYCPCICYFSLSWLL